MSLIPPLEIERIKRAISIVDVIGARVKLKKVGKDMVGLCPFHEEHSPSFNVSPSKGVYFCFGCAATGDAMRFIEEFEGRSFLDALQILADMAHLPMPQADRRPSAIDAMHAAVQFYESQLQADSPGALACREYLTSRGINSSTAQAFGLGYAPPTGVALVNGLKAKVADLAHLGLIDKTDRGGYRDRFRGRLVMPVRSPGGQVLGATARTLLGDKPKYLNSQVTEWFKKDKSLFGIDQFRKTVQARGASRADKVYVVEGQTDVMTAHSAGEPRFVGVMGRTVNPEQARSLLALADSVVFTFDGDEAGERSIHATLQILLESSGEAGRVRFKRLPIGEDPSSLILDKGLNAFYDAEETGFLETLIALLPKGESDDAQLARAEAGMVYLAKIRDPLLRDAATRAVAKAADLSPEAFADRLTISLEADRLAKEARAPRVTLQPASAMKQRQYFAPAAALWRALLEEPSVLTTLSWPPSLNSAEDEALKLLPTLAADYVGTDESPTAGTLSAALDDLGARDLVVAIYAMPAPSNPLGEARDALSLICKQLTKIEVAGFIDRVKNGETLSAEDRARYTALVQQPSNQERS